MKGNAMKRLLVAMVVLASLAFIAFGCDDNKSSCDITGAVADNRGTVENRFQASQFTSPLVPFTAYYDAGTVSVQSYFLDTIEYTLTVNFTQTINTGETSNKALVLSRLPEQQLEIGLRTELVDVNQNLLWRFDIQVDSNMNAPVHYKYVEATAVDLLEIEVTRVGDTTTEVYGLQGDDISLTYTPDEYETLKELACVPRQVFAKTSGTIPTMHIYELEEAGLRIMQLQQDVPTLYDNNDGVLLVEMFTDEAFITWLQHEINPEAQPINWTIEGLCKWIGRGTTIKCLFGGGFANPVCVIGTGYSLACMGYAAVSYVYREFNHSIYNK